MLIADRAPVYPRVRLPRYDLLSLLNQAAVYLHQVWAVDFQQALSSLLASTPVVQGAVAIVHATDPNCTAPKVLVMTLRRPVAWPAVLSPIDYLVVWRVPQLTSDTELAALQQQSQAAVIADRAALAQWRDDPVGLGWLAADMLATTQSN